MKISTAESGPRMVLDVSDTERSVAANAKEEFKGILKKLDKAILTIADLRDAVVDQRPSKDDLKSKYRGRLIRYRKKIKEVFNDFLSSTKTSLEKLSEISDPEMVRLREILIAEIDEFGAEGTLSSSINNLVEGGGCEAAFSADPLLSPLEDHGGPSWTHALLPGSPAIDAAPISECPLTSDQRGVPRPIISAIADTPCDIGSVEMQID